LNRKLFLQGDVSGSGGDDGGVLANQRTVGATRGQGSGREDASDPGVGAPIDAVITYDPFDPDRRVEVVLAPALRQRGVDRLRTRSRSSWVWTAIVAVAVVALLVGAWVHQGSAPTGGGPGPAKPGAQLEPAWTPAGLALWDLSWRDTPEPTDSARFAGPAVAQLFGSKSGSQKLLVTIQPLAPTSEAPPTPSRPNTTPVDVRGVVGSIAHESGVTTIEWNEQSADLRADLRGLDDAAALAALAGLRWRSARTSEGFEPTSAHDLEQVVGLQGAHAPRGTYGASFRYAASAGSADQVTVWTCPRGESLCGGYASTAFAGTTAADGSVSHFVAGSRAGAASAAEPTTFEEEWPDGGSIVLSGSTATIPDAATARHIASSLRATPVAALRAERDELSTRVSALPLLAAARLDGGRLELHGAGPTKAFCLQPPHAATSCRSLQGFGQDPTVDIGSVLVDGNWWLMAATTHGRLQLTADLNALVLEAEGLGKPLSSDTGSSGGQTLMLAAIPQGVPGAVVTDGDDVVVLHAPTN
jgi:hypothetical protein